MAAEGIPGIQIYGGIMVIEQLIANFLAVFKWKVNKDGQIVSTHDSISANPDIQAAVKNAPEDDPWIYSGADLLSAFQVWAEDNSFSANAVEMKRADFWNDENEHASPEIEKELAEREKEVAKHHENQPEEGTDGPSEG